MTDNSSFSPELIGVLAALLSCFIFLIFHQLTISNIWFSSPFMFLISALSGYLLVRSYNSLFLEYSLGTWIGYISYYIVGLTILALLSTFIFTPQYSSEQIISSGEAPPPMMILSALPLTIIWLTVSAIGITYTISRSFDAIPIVLATSTTLYMTLGLNISILGKVDVAPQHQYLVEKFMLMNIMLGLVFLVSYPLIREISMRY